MKTKGNLLLAVVIGGAFMVAAGTADAIDLKAWDNQINNPGRFKVLDDFAGAAVLDKETQLVWEQSPETAPHSTTPFFWFAAQISCNVRNVGGRKGWRLPTIQELASLIDPTIAPPGPTLPLGHPFSNVQSSSYWSATTLGEHTSDAWGVFFRDGVTFTGGKADSNHVWCVRGGQGVDPQ